MEKKNLPIKIFEKRKNVDERKTEGGGDGALPPWAQISDELLYTRSSDFKDVLKKTSEKLTNRDSVRDFIPAVIKIEMHEKATAKSHRSDISSLFDVNHRHNLIGLTDDRNILVAVNDLDDVKEINKKLNQPTKFKKGIASIVDMASFEPAITVEKVDENEPLRVSLINYHNYQLNEAVSRTFIELCKKKQIEVKKVNYSPELIVFRLSNINTDSFIDVKEFEAIETITQMPKYSITLDELSTKQATGIPIKEPQKGKTYPIVGILDSGIKDIPHLKPWIVSDNFLKIPSDRIDPAHGTFVSSIVVYGDELENKDYIGSDGCYLFDATVFPDLKKDTIEEFELVEHIREAIEKHKEKVKIWNLSLGTKDESDLTTFSFFGKALDQMQEQHNVIICKSAGNCSNFSINKPVSRISKSADSVRSLVVGSMTHDKGEHDHSERFHPSPFSRIGKGPSSINKPDLTHMGGNAGVHPITGKIVTTGVTSFSPAGNLVTNVGTSFSTPRISSLLAGIDNKLDEEFNPLLLKALAIHSAKYPDELSLPHTEKLKYLGYGMPSKIDDILYNDPHEITLILQDKLIKGNWIEIPDLPFPQSLVENGVYHGEIILTVVSAPLLSETQGGEYCQSNLEVRLGTYDKLKNRSGKMVRNVIGLDNSENLLRDALYSEIHKKSVTGDFARERTLIRYGDKYQPVKKYAVNLSEMTPTNKVKHLTSPKKWYLHVEGFYRDFIATRSEVDGVELSQEFCLILTIRDDKKKQNVYDQATKLLNDNGFIHNNINLKSEITIPVNVN